MPSFTGISVADGNNRCLCDTSAVEADGDSGYHLFMVKGYKRTKELMSMGDSITSDSFSVGDHDWLIEYYPNGDNPSCAGFISLFLTRLYDNDVEEEEVVEAKFSFSFVDQAEKQMPMYIRGTSQTCCFSTTAPTWGNGRFVRNDALERSADLKCDCFTIRCDVVVCNAKDDDASVLGGTKVLVPDIHQNFSTLLQTNVGADVTFEVGGETFAAHRCVLAARSQVFMAQLFGPMKEGTATSSVIQIKDMEANVFRALLSFVYTDSFPEMYEGITEENDMSEAVEQGKEEEMVEDETGLQWLLDLLVAADRFDLQRLKFICEKQLSQLIDVNSVASTLALAEQHHCRGLKEACLKFIQVQSPSRLQTIMATDGWEHIITTYPSVLNEFIAKLIASNRK